MAEVLRCLSQNRLCCPLVSDHPAANQPTPYRLNRYILLVMYLIYTWLTSFVFFGWAPLSTMLARHGTYSWLCEPEERSNPTNIVSGQPACDEQGLSIHRLFTVGYASRFVCSGISGYLVDAAGPKVTAVLGQVLNVCGWSILGACNENFQAIIPAVVLIGAGSDMGYLPMLCICSLFPGCAGLGLALMGSAASMSTSVPLIMNAINEGGVDFPIVCWVYVILGPMVCLSIVVLLVPLDGFVAADRFVVVPDQPCVSEVDDPPMFSPSPNKGDAQAVSVPEEAGRMRTSLVSPDDSALPAPGRMTDISTVTDEDFFLPFKAEACTFLYIGICLYFAVTGVAVNYYQQGAWLFLSDRAFKSMDVALPLSVFPCLFVGYMADRLPIVPILMIINLCGALSYLFAGLYGDVVSRLSVLFFSFYISVFFTQVYIFVKKVFTSVHFGKLVGIVSMLGGVVSLVGWVLYEVTLRHLKRNKGALVWTTFGVLIAMNLVLVPMIFVLKRRRKASQIATVPIPMSGVSEP